MVNVSETDVVVVRGLSKSYGCRRVVDGLDLDVQASEIVGLIGANGAGKTTTVECVQGLRRPDAGRLRVLGLDPATQGERLRGLVGSQLQSSRLPDRLRVGEALQLFAGRRDEGLLEKFGLGGRERDAFASLSGGERQRLFLVLALVNRPRLVILDELTQGLDPSARRGVWAAIDQLRAEGIAVLLVTHELEEAERLCDRVVAMRSGRVLDAGSPAELVDRHGAWAKVSFSLPSGSPAVVSAERLGRLPGVREVSLHGRRMNVRGERRAIAHVSSALVEIGWVPPDLCVKVPSLEDALVDLLERACADEIAADAADSTVQPEPIGASR
jgi:ABC-2 type transport system ATP-binding protein